MNLLTEEEAAAYEEATDGCRRLVRVTSDNAPQWQRVKPDEELHLMAELNYEGGDVGSSLCRVLLLCERVRAFDEDHAFGFQLLGGDVTAHSSLRSITAIRAIRNLHATQS